MLRVKSEIVLSFDAPFVYKRRKVWIPVGCHLRGARSENRAVSVLAPRASSSRRVTQTSMRLRFSIIDEKPTTSAARIAARRRVVIRGALRGEDPPDKPSRWG